MTDPSDPLCDEFEKFQRTIMSNEQNESLMPTAPEIPDGQASSVNGNSVYEEPLANPRPMYPENPNTSDMDRLLQFMMHENKRRDELMERMMTRMMPSSMSPVSQSTAYHIMPDLSKSITTFDGEGDSLRAREWYNNIKSMQQLHNWPDSFVLEAARANLRKGALHWFNSRIEQITTWEKFKCAFEKTFIRTESITLKWKNMSERVQQKGESVSSYFHEKIKLCHDLDLKFRDTKEQILVGLWSKELCSAVAAMNHSDPDDLLHDILSQEKLQQQRYDRIRTSKGVTQTNENKGTNRFKPNLDKKPDVTDRKETQTKEYTSKPEQEGRLPARNSDGKPLCFKCKRYGHVSKYCSSRRSTFQLTENTSNANETNGETTSALASTSINGKENNFKYFQEAKIDGQPVKAYVDLGSQCVMLREEDAVNLNLKYDQLESPLCIRGFGDGKIIPLGKIMTTIEVDQAKAITEILIVPNDSQQVPLLIGQPFTEQQHIVIIRRGNTLRIFEENPEIENDECLRNLKIPALPKPKINLWAKNTCVIPSDYVGFIAVYAEERKEADLFIETLTNYERCIPRCVIRLNDEGEAEIPVVNITGKDIVLHENEKLTKGELCTEEREIEVKITSVDDSDMNKASKIEVEMINVNPKISENEKVKLYGLLEKYEDCFAMNMFELGLSNQVECNIETLTDVPVTFRPYRLSFSEREKVRDMIEELKRAGIVVDSNSSYASPILIVHKKTGDERLCIDYRGLNKITKKENYPLPHIDDQLDRLSAKKFFTTLDMRSGYYQIPVAKDSQHKTAFITPDGMFEFLRMPFGIVNGPAIFQRLINSVLGPLRFSIAMAYMDDILLPSVSTEEGLKNLQEILEVLRRANLKLNLRKCYFLYETIDYLGFEISACGIKPGKKKLSSVIDFPVPKDVRAVRQFLGLTGYFRRFIKNYAIITRPLTTLLQKDYKWTWDEAQIAAFEKLKSELVSDNVLALYRPEAYTEVHTDASQLGLAGILFQQGSDERMHPVVYISRQTTPDEQKYHANELETLCVIWTMEKLRVYLIGRPFVVVTDCNALRSTFVKKNLVPRIGRWWLKSLEFTYDIVHRPGTQMSHVDALSRNPTGEPEETDCANGVHILMNTLEEDDWLCLVQKQDPHTVGIMETLSRGKTDTEEEKRIDKEYEVKDGRLFRKDDNKLLWVVPKRVRWQIVKKCHDDLGHPAYAKTLSKAKEHYWWPRMRNYIKGYIGSCLECLYNKVPGGKHQGKLHSIDKIGVPFHTIHLDHLGPFVKSKKGYNYILVIIDGFTKFALLKPVRDTTSLSSAKILEELIHIFGPPYRVISDRGTSFTGASFRNLCKQKKIIHILNATSTARANGQVERVNRVITTALASLTRSDDGRDWDKHVGRLQWSINNTYHQAIKCTPFSLLFNFDPRALDGDPLQDELNKNKLLNEDIVQRRMNAIEEIRRDQKKQQDRYNRRRAKATDYEPGDLVMVRREVSSTGGSTKLLNKYAGPYIITEKLPYDRYRIEDMPEIQRSQRFYRGVAPVDALKRYEISNDEESDTNGENDEEETEKEHDYPEINDIKLETSKEAMKEKRKKFKPKHLQDFVC